MTTPSFSKSGDPRYFWTEHVKAHDADIALTWYDIGEPLLIHTEPNQPPQNRPYGVCTVLVPALGARLTINGKQARGKPWKREREGRPFSTCALAFSRAGRGWREASARNPRAVTENRFPSPRTSSLRSCNAEASDTPSSPARWS